MKSVTTMLPTPPSLPSTLTLLITVHLCLCIIFPTTGQVFILFGVDSLGSLKINHKFFDYLALTSALASPSLKCPVTCKIHANENLIGIGLEFQWYLWSIFKLPRRTSRNIVNIQLAFLEHQPHQLYIVSPTVSKVLKAARSSWCLFLSTLLLWGVMNIASCTGC